MSWKIHWVGQKLPAPLFNMEGKGGWGCFMSTVELSAENNMFQQQGFFLIIIILVKNCIIIIKRPMGTLKTAQNLMRVGV